jgi:hypothetical protein
LVFLEDFRIWFDLVIFAKIMKETIYKSEKGKEKTEKKYKRAAGDRSAWRQKRPTAQLNQSRIGTQPPLSPC